jgi:hypothetical protein
MGIREMESNKTQPITPKDIFEHITDNAIIQMKRALGMYYFDVELSEEEKKIINYKQSSEKPISLIKSFRYKIPNDIELPVPFINLWNNIQEKIQDYSFSTTESGEIVGHFWRLYSVYRHGKSYSLCLKQIELCNDTVKDFWAEQLPILSKKIYPYVLVNRYLIMPLNRTINRVKGLL